MTEVGEWRSHPCLTERSECQLFEHWKTLMNRQDQELEKVGGEGQAAWPLRIRFC